MQGALKTLNWRWSAGSLLLILIVLSVLDYAVGVRSEAMAFARSRIETSPGVQREVGAPISVSLRKVWGYTYRSGYGNSEANLDLIVRGPHGERRMTIHIQQSKGAWEVVKSTIPL